MTGEYVNAAQIETLVYRIHEERRRIAGQGRHAMLVISRRRGESIVINDNITITVLDIRGDKVRLAVVCPKEVPIHREEVWLAIRDSALPAPPSPPSAEELAFVKSVLDSPDDEGIRLIFADWLQDHDDPRGEFIHVQCRLARLPNHDEQRSSLEKRERLLWSQYERLWRAHLPGVLRQAPFRRGFVESADLEVKEFLTNAVDIFASSPLRRLRVLPGELTQSGPGPIVPTLAGSAYLGRLAAVDLSGLGLTDADAAVLAASPHVTGLTELSLARNRIGYAGARALATSTSFGDELAIDLSGNPLGAIGVRILKDRFGSRVRF
jgi:carbon storage regulator CsrA